MTKMYRPPWQEILAMPQMNEAYWECPGCGNCLTGFGGDATTRSRARAHWQNGCFDESVIAERDDERIAALEKRIAALEALEPEDRFRALELEVSCLTGSEGRRGFTAALYPGEAEAARKRHNELLLRLAIKEELGRRNPNMHTVAELRRALGQE